MNKYILLIISGFLIGPAFGQSVEKTGGTAAADINKAASVPLNTVAAIGGTIVPGVYANCKEIKDNHPDAKDGIYNIDPDGEGEMEAFDCYCDMTTDGGGWTLVTVHSNDGQANWTYNNRALFYNETFIGSVNQLHFDYKGRAMIHLNFKDVLAIHAPSGVWAAYHNVGNGSTSLGYHITTIPFPNCTTTSGYTMSAGTLSTSGTSLCNTNLFFNIGDYDGGGLSNCSNLGSTLNNATYGPAWSVNQNNGCPFDDPGTHSSLGINYQAKDTEQTAIGFGWAIGGNTGTAGTGDNHMKIFIR